MESKQRHDQLLAQENEHSNKKQISDLTPNPALELQRFPAHPFSTTTIKTKPDIIDDNREFDQMMKAMRAEHDQTMAKIKTAQHDPNRYAIEQLTQQIERDNERDRQRIDQISSSPQIIVIREEQSENKLLTVGKEFVKVVTKVGADAVSLLHGPPHKHRSIPRHRNNRHSSHSSAPHSFNQHRKSHNND